MGIIPFKKSDENQSEFSDSDKNRELDTNQKLNLSDGQDENLHQCKKEKKRSESYEQDIPEESLSKIAKTQEEFSGMIPIKSRKTLFYPYIKYISPNLA